MTLGMQSIKTQWKQRDRILSWFQHLVVLTPLTLESDGGIATVTYVTAPEAIASNSILMMTAEVILSGPNGHQMVA